MQDLFRQADAWHPGQPWSALVSPGQVVSEVQEVRQWEVWKFFGMVHGDA